jgi:hypothetical protein
MMMMMMMRRRRRVMMMRMRRRRDVCNVRGRTHIFIGVGTPEMYVRNCMSTHLSLNCSVGLELRCRPTPGLNFTGV